MSDSGIARIAETHGVVLLLQFGSSVTGRTHARSDVDLAVLLDRPRVSLSDRAALLHDLQALFPDREVDLAIVNYADPLFLKKIMETCRLLHGDPRQLQRLRIYAFKRYQDHRRYLDMERRFVARSLETDTL
ncbi:MAG: nucleotidyltransferase domain-containing protein [Candidatus Rokubacteria bacterium]|nr:nucleotidyltransferase domain-containing protein [Candidatus Rokubacteria bacterium]